MKTIVRCVAALILLFFFWDKFWPDPELTTWQNAIDGRCDRVSAILVRCREIDDEFETLKLAPAAMTTSSDFNLVAVKTDICLKKIQALNLELIDLYSKKPHNLPLTKKEQENLASLKRSVSAAWGEKSEESIAATETPSPTTVTTPAIQFKEIRLKTGAILRDVSSLRKEADGFSCLMRGQPFKILNKHLNSDLYQDLSAAAR